MPSLPEEEWVEVLGADGQPVGWSLVEDVRATGFPIFEIVDPPRFIKDPYVINTADVASEQGLLRGPDLNDIQLALLMSVMVRRSIREGDKREDALLEQILIHRPEHYQAIMESRKAEQQVAEDRIEWTTPSSPDEFTAFLQAHGAEQEKEGNGHHQNPLGLVLTEFMSDEDLEQMSD